MTGSESGSANDSGAADDSCDVPSFDLADVVTSSDGEEPPGSSTGGGDDDLWDLLSKLERQSQTSYDRAILALSGGALGVTIAFVKDMIHGTPRAGGLLFASWVCWALSLACVL